MENSAWLDAGQRSVLVFGSTLSPTQRLILLVLNRYCDGAGENCFPSVATIAAMSGMTTRGVHNVIEQLEALGILERNRRYKDNGQGLISNLYKIKFPRIPQRTANVVQGGSERSSGGVVNVVQGGSERSSGGVVNVVQGGSERSSQYQYQLTTPSLTTEFKAAAAAEFFEPEKERGAIAPLTGKVDTHPDGSEALLRELEALVGITASQGRKLLNEWGHDHCTRCIEIWKNRDTSDVRNHGAYFRQILRGESASSTGERVHNPPADFEWFAAGKAKGLFIATSGYGDSQRVYTGPEWGEKCLSVDEAQKLLQDYLSGKASPLDRSQWGNPFPILPGPQSQQAIPPLSRIISGLAS